MIPHPEDTIVALSSAAGPGVRGIVRISGPNTGHVVASVLASLDDVRNSETTPHPLLTPFGATSPAGGEVKSVAGGQETRSQPDSTSPPVGEVAAQRRVGGNLQDTNILQGIPPRHWQPVSLRLTGFASTLPAELYFFRAPNSYTGQDLAELHTVSSPPILERLIADVLNAGARSAQPGEFTLRAFLVGKKNLPRAEAVLSVIEAGSESDLTKALAQLAGGVTEPLAAMRDDLLNLLADVEAGLDFTEEDIEFVTRPDIIARLGAAIAQCVNVRRQLETRAVSGRPVRVAIVGEPNAGKSSLYNALLGNASALVSDVAGTTRDYLTAAFTIDGIELELIDTAGWQHANDTIEEQAQRLGREQSERADVLLWCVPANEEGKSTPHPLLTSFGSTSPTREEVKSVAGVSDARAQPDPTSPLVGEVAAQRRVGGGIPLSTAKKLAKATNAELLIVRTKADLAEVREGIPASAVQPHGLDELRKELAAVAASLARPSLAPSQSRCRHHIDAAIENLRIAHKHATFNDPPELLALALRQSLDNIGEMTGAIYTNDLLDRIFSRFCIGK